MFRQTNAGIPVILSFLSRQIRYCRLQVCSKKESPSATGNRNSSSSGNTTPLPHQPEPSRQGPTTRYPYTPPLATEPAGKPVPPVCPGKPPSVPPTWKAVPRHGNNRTTRTNIRYLYKSFPRCAGIPPLQQ